MAVLFFGLLTPVAIITRWAGRDLLRLRIDPSTSSYWIRRASSGDRQTLMTSQF
jgi:hypothetical protein